MKKFYSLLITICISCFCNAQSEEQLWKVADSLHTQVFIRKWNTAIELEKEEAMKTALKYLEKIISKESRSEIYIYAIETTAEYYGQLKNYKNTIRINKQILALDKLNFSNDSLGEQRLKEIKGRAYYRLFLIYMGEQNLKKAYQYLNHFGYLEYYNSSWCGQGRMGDMNYIQMLEIKCLAGLKKYDKALGRLKTVIQHSDCMYIGGCSMDLWIKIIQKRYNKKAIAEVLKNSADRIKLDTSFIQSYREQVGEDWIHLEGNIGDECDLISAITEVFGNQIWIMPPLESKKELSKLVILYAKNEIDSTHFITFFKNLWNQSEMYKKIQFVVEDK